MNKDVSVRSHI